MTQGDYRMKKITFIAKEQVDPYDAVVVEVPGILRKILERCGYPCKRYVRPIRKKEKHEKRIACD